MHLHDTRPAMLRPSRRPRWLICRLTAPPVTPQLSLLTLHHLFALSEFNSPICRLRWSARPFTQFNVAAVRLLRLTLLDKPALAPAREQQATRSTNQPVDSAVVASASKQSRDTARFVPPAVLHDTQAWERWLDGINGEQTFLVSRTLLPQLFERLNHSEQHSHTAVQLTAAGSGLTAQQLNHSMGDNLQQLGAAPAVSTAGTSTSLALLNQRLSEVQSLPLATLVAPQQQRTKQQRASTAIPPAPSLQPPLIQQQKAVFEAVPSADLSTIATLYSPSSMPVNQPHPSHGGTMLHIAAMHNKADVVQWLLSEHGADPNCRAFNHSTPLHWAAGNNAIAALHALLAHGADPTLTSMTHHSTTVGKGSGQTALHWAAESGHVDSVRLLSEWAPQLVAVEDERGRPARELAEAEGRSEVARLVRRLEGEEYVGVKVELAYRGQRIIGAQQRDGSSDPPR